MFGEIRKKKRNDMMNREFEVQDTEVQLSFFEKYLAIWVALCMGIGLLLSQFFPALSNAVNNFQINGISVPIGICLFLMIYPALLNLQMGGIKEINA